MKENVDQHLEKLVEKLMKDTSLEAPSANFTANLMQSLPERSTATVYKPLISKKTWFLIGTGIFAMLVYYFFYTTGQSSVWSGQLIFNKLNFNFLSNLGEVRVSSITLYTIASAALMLFVQLLVIWKYFNRRINARMFN